MTLEEEQLFISNFLNYPNTSTPEFPIKKTIVKLGLMCPRTYSLNPTVISLLFEYAQNGCADEYGEC